MEHNNKAAGNEHATLSKVLGRRLASAALVMVASGCAAEMLDEQPMTDMAAEEIGETSQALTLRSFAASYVNFNPYYNNCSGNGWGFPGPNGDIKGYEPEEIGDGYPVYVYVMGTNAPWDVSIDEALIQYMASKGFVAATIEYHNSAYPTTCANAEKRAECIFDQSKAQSAITKLCGRARADCSKGIYVSGHSQGAHLASLAANFGSDYRAAYLMGNGNVAQCGIVDVDLSACLDKSNLAFSSSQIRSVSGVRDACFGTNQAGVQRQLQDTTGVTCSAGTYNCLQADGSGWLIVQDAQPLDGQADHCYMSNGGCLNYATVDTSWSTGTSAEWQMKQNLDWLASQ